MGLMRAWENWALKQWRGWGSKLQSEYDRYRQLKTPVWYIELTESIWDTLDDKIKSLLNAVIAEAGKIADEEFAKDILDKIVKAIKKKLNL